MDVGSLLFGTNSRDSELYTTRQEAFLKPVHFGLGYHPLDPVKILFRTDETIGK